MKKCIWATYRIEDFEEQWKKLVEEHELEQNEWLQQLYEICESWVPVNNRRTFFAGMNTTGRSEGTNALFDDFVTSMTNLREFVVKYEQALHKIITRESSEDFTSEHKYCIVNDDDFLLKHAAQVYTRNIFEKFKSEWSRVKWLKVEERGFDDQFHRYSLMKKNDNSKEFLVELNLQTREALVKNDGKEQSEALRFSHMSRTATQLACYAAPSDEAYTMYMDGLDELCKKNSKVNKVSKEDAMESQDNVFRDEADQCTSKSSESLLLDPNISKTKGRKKDENSRRKSKSSKRIKGDHIVSLDV
ncbi:protein FAR1-RELATED SEQUENCE 5-like [Rosa rugosa]|uniref:protein FAR1-RELATED SEQUENCE 5-like n=1 Tax=Rosa rugosa TaxID=74645 RepID=UPI002B40A936|nr:protein FAR1-RELATED SEQUENCE 5-like [Rosa rugosa]